MKKWLCLLLAGVLLLMCACGLQDKPTSHTYTLAPARDDPNVKILTVTETATKKELQTIRLEGNEWFVAEPIYTDITFDGNRDILVPFQRAASGVFFAGYVWNEKTGQYVYAPYLENIPNIAVDAEKEQLLSHRTQSQITSYCIYRYNEEKRDFESVRSLYWERQENDAYMRVVETQYTEGEEEPVKQFSVAASNPIDADKTDANMAPYYVAGSRWDLDSAKWNNTVYAADMSKEP